jgi:hypothetical protein
MSGLLTINDSFIQVIPDKRAALAACVKLSGLPPKAVAGALHIEYSHFIKMIGTTGGDSRRHFPHEKETALMDICRNEVPLSWLLLKRGYPSLHVVTCMQAELAALRVEVEQLRHDHRSITNVFKFMGADE